MDEKEPFEHDEVVSSLLDLQRRLRGGDSGTAEAAPDTSRDASRAETSVRTVDEPRTQEPRPSQTVEVFEPEISVLMAPVVEPEAHATDALSAGERFAPVTQLPTTAAGDDRVAALAQRLGRLEQDLSGVLESIGTMQGDVTAEVTADVAGRMASMQEETDARTARLVADRMDAVSNRLSGELGDQRRDLAGLLERRIADMESTLDDAIRDAAAGDGDPGDAPN